MNPILYQRFLKSWSQAQLSTESGISRVSISRIENGKQRPTEETKRKLAVALGVTTDELLKEE